MKLLSVLLLLFLQVSFGDWEWLGSYQLSEEDYCYDCGGCLTYLIFLPSPRGRVNVYQIYGEAWENVRGSDDRNGPLELITDGSEEDPDGVIWSYRVGIGWALEREDDAVHFKIFYDLWGVSNLCNTTLTRIDCSAESFCDCVDQTKCPGWGWSSGDRECKFDIITSPEEINDHDCAQRDHHTSSNHNTIPSPETTDPPVAPHSNPPEHVADSSPPTVIDEPIILPPTPIPVNTPKTPSTSSDMVLAAHTLPDVSSEQRDAHTTRATRTTECENDAHWESEYGTCDDYYVAYFKYCNVDIGTGDVVADEACPKACDKCEEKCGNCLRSGRGESGCDNETVERCVCDSDGYCCDNNYDDQCVDIAKRDCGCEDE